MRTLLTIFGVVLSLSVQAQAKTAKGVWTCQISGRLIAMAYDGTTVNGDGRLECAHPSGQKYSLPLTIAGPAKSVSLKADDAHASFRSETFPMRVKVRSLGAMFSISETLNKGRLIRLIGVNAEGRALPAELLLNMKYANEFSRTTMMSLHLNPHDSLILRGGRLGS